MARFPADAGKSLHQSRQRRCCARTTKRYFSVNCGTDINVNAAKRPKSVGGAQIGCPRTPATRRSECKSTVTGVCTQNPCPGFERNRDISTGIRRRRSALRLLNSAIGGSKLWLSLGVRDGTGFYRFLCPGFDRRRTVGRPGHVSHPATQCLPIALAILAEAEQIDDSTR